MQYNDYNEASMH